MKYRLKHRVEALRNAAHDIMDVAEPADNGAVAVIERWKGMTGWATWLAGDSQGVSHAAWTDAVERAIKHLDTRSPVARYVVERVAESDMNGPSLQVREVPRAHPDGMDPNLTIKTVQAMVRLL